MITYIIYALASAYPQVVVSLLCLYITLVVVIGVKWEKLTTLARALSLFCISIPLVIAGMIYSVLWFEHSSDTIRKFDYKGGCKVEELINGDCIFDSIRWEHANFYPAVTEDDGIWQRLEGQDKTDLLKIAEQELERLRVGKYKGQEEQIARVQSFIDILERRYGVTAEKEIPAETRNFLLPEIGKTILLPGGYVVSKSGELNRRGSFASYNFDQITPTGEPYLAEIQFFSLKSIKDFKSKCGDDPCFFGDYPNEERFLGQKHSLQKGFGYKGYELQKLHSRAWLVSTRKCDGDTCSIREYTTFLGETKVDVWIMLPYRTTEQQADTLFTQFEVQ